MDSVFEFDSYKEFLLAVEHNRAALERGFRTRLAESLGCQNAYVSNVLNKDAHFSLEQGLKICGFLALAGDERKFLLTLIEHARAGTPELRAHFAEELSAMRTKRLNLKDRVGAAFSLSAEAQSVYYSHWTYAAIHMLTTLPDRRDLNGIADALRLPVETVRHALLFLTSVGLVQEKGGRLTAGQSQVHLGRESHQILQHHTNWRLAAIESLMQVAVNDVHYSTVSTLSAADAEKLKARFAKEIEHYVKTVRASPEETLYGFNLDFYSLTKE
jgi:uncharacterized protein (TIGR02147 family)